uniref:non-specific serine/threonine protein kinase n=1 Tax=Anthurium amnicola TaxID=1678845 RepID=A0A1D1Z8I9_9ARAE
MKNILKKLHIMASQSDDTPATAHDGSPFSSSKGRSSSSRNRTGSPSRRLLPTHSEQKPLSGLSNWLSSVTSRHGSSGSPPMTLTSTSSSSSSSPLHVSRDREKHGDGVGTYPFTGSEVGRDASAECSELGKSRELDDEEYQIQVALELSAREDPEAVQIEAVKQISLGSCPVENTPAEVLAFRYWNYNVLGYDDKILDGFYDLYGILAESTSTKMPSLIDLQKIPVSDAICWEAILVNRASDADLFALEQRALVMALESQSGSTDYVGSDLVKCLAILVADYMGGGVGNSEVMSKEWMNLNNRLRTNLGNMVLPLGCLTVGLARHRALLFKVLADSVGIPCQLVKGQMYTGSDDGAINIVKINDGREYIVDLMAAPGTLIPSDAGGHQRECDISSSSVSSSIRDVENFRVASSCGASISIGCFSENETEDKRLSVTSESERGFFAARYQEEQFLKSSQDEFSKQGLTSDRSKISEDSSDFCSNQSVPTHRPSPRPNHPYALARSPSWTEGINSTAVQRRKVKDVSQYMIDAAKENPQLAQKLHDVLLESGVVAPPNLFTEIGTEQPCSVVSKDVTVSDDKNEITKRKDGTKQKSQADPANLQFSLSNDNVQKLFFRPQLDYLKPVEGLGVPRPLDVGDATGVPCSSQSEVAGQLQTSPINFMKSMPVAAAAATAAVVASSMVVAAAKSSSERNLEVPVAAAATATAAVVAATTAAVSRQYEQSESPAISFVPYRGYIDSTQKSCEDEGGTNEQSVSGHGYDGISDHEHDAHEAHQENERSSDKSTGNESAKSDVALDDVAEFEILWEDIILGERIGLGSYGEVYRGDWHGTEVAVKKFLQQDISGDALEEFRSEVRIMKRLRHPNVVLFMGAVTRVPNLSIVTEFLPRGSLFRLIHRPNNQLDERRRLRMALDVARGMNYLHNCTPMIVHGDLKSPNLLVDKNWVVKVCDFGLSRMKHSTFLSSRSMAGTAEWMAPEVLRNELSDEKCDVYSFGVILWELCTLQQPWEGMNPMQVVGAVGFQQRRLDIPDDMDPVIANIIVKCWQTDPKMRPSFSEIMAALKPLQKSVPSTQMVRQ